MVYNVLAVEDVGGGHIRKANHDENSLRFSQSLMESMVVGVLNVESGDHNIVLPLVFLKLSLVDRVLGVRCSELVKEL